MKKYFYKHFVKNRKNVKRFLKFVTEMNGKINFKKQNILTNKKKRTKINRKVKNRNKMNNKKIKK